MICVAPVFLNMPCIWHLLNKFCISYTREKKIVKYILHLVQNIRRNIMTEDVYVTDNCAERLVDVWHSSGIFNQEQCSLLRRVE